MQDGAGVLFLLCTNIFNLIKNEKKDKFYAPENLQTNLFQIYDEKMQFILKER